MRQGESGGQRPCAGRAGPVPGRCSRAQGNCGSIAGVPCAGRTAQRLRLHIPVRAGVRACAGIHEGEPQQPQLVHPQRGVRSPRAPLAQPQRTTATGT